MQIADHHAPGFSGTACVPRFIENFNQQAFRLDVKSAVIRTLQGNGSDLIAL